MPFPRVRTPFGEYLIYSSETVPLRTSRKLDEPDRIPLRQCRRRQYVEFGGDLLQVSHQFHLFRSDRCYRCRRPEFSALLDTRPSDFQFCNSSIAKSATVIGIQSNRLVEIRNGAVVVAFFRIS